MPMEIEPHAKSKALDGFLGTLLGNQHLLQAKTSGLVPWVERVADEQSMKIKGFASFSTPSLQLIV